MVIITVLTFLYNFFFIILLCLLKGMEKKTESLYALLDVLVMRLVTILGC